MSLFWTEGEWLRKIAVDDAGEVVPRRVIDSDWTKPDDFPDLTACDVLAIDVETSDPDLLLTGSKWAWPGHDGFVCGVSVAWEGGKRYYPLRHEAGGNMEDEAQVWRWLAAQIDRPNLMLVGSNVAYDFGWIETTLGRRLKCLPLDIQGAAALLDEHRLSYALDALGKDVLGIGKNESLLYEAAAEFGFQKNVKGSLWRLPAPYVGPYAEDDSALALSLWNHYRPKLEAEGLSALFHMEQRVLRLAIDMRRRGVKVNAGKVAAGIDHCRQREEQAKEAIWTHTGINVDPWDALSLEAALKEHGLIVPRTAKDKPSVTRSWLAEFGDDPVTSAIIDLRKWNKLRTTFFEGHLGRFAWRGRIHCEFNPLRRQDDEGTGWGTVSGRFSSNDPNLQQIPHRDPETTPFIRECFEPEDGCQWYVLDYHSQEPRLTVHFAAKTEQVRPDLVTGAIEVVDLFRRQPRTDLHQHTAERMGVPRGRAKAINLGITYGMQGKRLCWELGLPTKWETGWNGRSYEVAGDEGAALLAAHRAAVPFIDNLFNVAQARAKNAGSIRTLLGRVCHFRPLPSGDGYFDVFKALNRLIQGSAADQMKKAMLDLEDNGIVLSLQVHDEVDLSLPDNPTARRAREIMENAVTLLLPVRVDISAGSSWGTVSKVADEREPV